MNTKKGFAPIVILIVFMAAYKIFSYRYSPPAVSSHTTADPSSWPQDPTGKYTLNMVDMDNHGNEWSVLIYYTGTSYSVSVNNFYPVLQQAFPNLDESTLDRISILSLFPENIGPWSSDGKYLWGLVVDINKKTIAHYRIDPAEKVLKIIK